MQNYYASLLCNNTKCVQLKKCNGQSRVQYNTEPEVTIWATIYTRKISTIRQPLRGTKSTSWNKAYLTAKKYMVPRDPIGHGGVMHTPLKDQVFIGGMEIPYLIYAMLLKLQITIICQNPLASTDNI